MNNHIMMKEFTRDFISSYNESFYSEQLVALYNELHISEDKVDKLIISGKALHSDDVVVITKTQYENLCKSKKEE